jgi:hypothetical protein
VSGTYRPGDLVVIAGPPRWGCIGLVQEVIDLDDDGVFYDVRTPGRAPMPFRPDELRAPTAADKAEHHPSWLAALAEDWQRISKAQRPS